MHDEIQLDIRRRLVPAWLLSIGVHVALIISLSFLVVRAGDSSFQTELARPVGIVLARKSADLEPEYFDETSSDATDRDAPTASDAAPRPLPPRVAASQPESLVAAEFALPKTSDVPFAGISTINSPSLKVSNSRPQLPGIDESAIIAEEQARLRAANARGPTTSLGVFGSKEAVGGSFVFLIDRSQSMGGGGLGVLKDAEQELVRALERLEAKHRFQVVVYHNQSVYLARRELLPATDANKGLVPEFLNTKAAFGATEHERALMSALSLEPDVIFLLTDGGEPVLKDQQVRAIARLASPRTAIHCIQFGSGPLQDADNFLARLAAATGGEYGYVDVRTRRP